jgi:hypothetical protein
MTSQTQFRPLWAAAVVLSVGVCQLPAADSPNLAPLLAVPDRVVLQEDYATPKPLDAKVYSQRQGTRWKIEDGVLRGRPSSPEFQAKKKDHQGLEPRISIPACPRDFVVRFDVRFIGGEKTPRFPFVEFGHHVARLAWSNGGDAALLAENETVQLATYPGFKVEPGKWYHALAEIEGEELVIQFAGGPTVYARQKSFDQEKSGFGVCGTRGGTVELDNVTLWSVKKDPQPGWEAARAKLPPPTKPVTIKAKKP